MPRAAYTYITHLFPSVAVVVPEGGRELFWVHIVEAVCTHRSLITPGGCLTFSIHHHCMRYSPHLIILFITCDTL